jgi:hypothetical protein
VKCVFADVNIKLLVAEKLPAEKIGNDSIVSMRISEPRIMFMTMYQQIEFEFIKLI